MSYLQKRETIWNDLKRPTTSKKQNELTRPQTTYNEQETTWNELKRPTTSKKRSATTWNNLQRAATTTTKKKRSDQQRAHFKIILQYDAIVSLLEHVFHPTYFNHSSIASWRIMVKVERQTSIKSCVFTTGYRICRIRYVPLWHS